MSELIFRSDGTYVEDPSGELVPVKVHYTRLDAPPSIDADHAVALEREAIAQMVSRCAEVVRDNPLEFRFGGHAEADRLWNLAEDIRNGLHHANTPPASRERGQGRPSGADMGLNDADVISDAQNAETDGKENK